MKAHRRKDDQGERWKTASLTASEETNLANILTLDSGLWNREKTHICSVSPICDDLSQQP